MDFCSPCWRPRCGLLVGSCCCIGANAPTGACGGPKCPSIACAGLSVGCGKPILLAWWAGSPIVGALTSPGPSVPYPGGPPFGTSADLCSKTLLWVMKYLCEEPGYNTSVMAGVLFAASFGAGPRLCACGAPADFRNERDGAPQRECRLVALCG